MIFRPMLVIKHLMVAVDIHTMEANGYQQLFYQHSSKYHLFGSTEEKLLYVWNNMRVNDTSFFGEVSLYYVRSGPRAKPFLGLMWY